MYCKLCSQREQHQATATEFNLWFTFMRNSSNVVWAQALFVLSCHVLTNMVWVIETKIMWKWSEAKWKLLRVSGRFELSRVWVTEAKITNSNCMTEIQGKLTLVWVWRGFMLVRVWVIGSRLKTYLMVGFYNRCGSCSGVMVNVSWESNITPNIYYY